MRNIKILHLYSNTLDLYGDYKNLTVLCKRIRETGNEVTVETAELFEGINFSAYDMVYIGHGKARNLAAVAKHFVKYADAVKTAIENGQVWLATGNSRQLFGKGFSTTDGSIVEGIGVFDYTAVETNRVFVSDMLANPVYNPDEIVYGFANRTAYLEGENKNPLFMVTNGFGDGKEANGTEGTLYKNFFGTWSMGPVLVRNPSLMKEILKRLLKEDYHECDFTLEEKALQLVAAEFKKG